MGLKICSLIDFYRNYFGSIFDGFDPLIDGPKLPLTFPDKSRFHLKYFLPFLLTFGVVIDSAILVYLNDWQLYPLPELFQRIVTWPSYWDEFDSIFIGCHVMLPCTYLTLTMSRFGHRANFLYKPSRDSDQLVTSSGSKISNRLSKTLWAFRMKLFPHMRISKFTMVINLNIVYTVSSYYSFILEPTWSLRILVSLLFCPWYITYLGYNLTIGNYFWLTMKYVEIKQKYQLEQFRKIIDLVERSQTTKRAWRYYREILKHSLAIIKEIKIYQGFWSAPNTIILSVYIFEICKIAYMAVTAKSNQHRLHMTPLIIIVILHYVFIYVVTGTASDLIANNIQTYKSMRMFHTRYQHLTVSFRENLKISVLECYSDYFRKGCFRLLNGYVINHKLLEFLLAYIVITSLKLFGRQLHQALHY